MQSIPELLHRHDAEHKPWYRRSALVVSIALHVALGALFIIAPTFLVSAAKPPEFVSIQIVPAAALGQVAPPPAPATESAPTPATPPPAVQATPSSKRRSREKAKEPAKVVQRTKEAPKAIESKAVVTSRSSNEPTPRQGSPKGSPLATGTSSEISGFDDPDFTYGYYADLMLSRLRAVWQRPPLGGEVEMVVHFRIFTDGRVDDVKILRSSGYNSFDRAGLQAVQQATMPPLPKSYRSPSLGVRLVIR